MRQSPDTYFVRIDTGSPAAQSGSAPVHGRAGLGASGPPRRRRHRRRLSGRAVFLGLILVGLGTWVVWAAQRPGGVSGTVNSWISNVRGDVAKVSSDPDLGKARSYFSQQYKLHGAYPQVAEADLAGHGIGVGVTVEWCSDQAVVLQGSSGGGTSSRLLLSGHDLGELPARYDCPANLGDPAPWKKQS